MAFYSSPFVLEGSWVEQRADPPALPPQNTYVSTSRAAYGGAPVIPHVKPARAGILGASSWNEASYSTGGAVGSTKEKGFDTTHGGRLMNAEEVAATFHSVARDAMAAGVNVSASAMADAAKTLKAVAGTRVAVAAGGAGSVTLDRGKRIVGAAGEKVMEGDDARLNTMAQRSWLSRPDAGLVNFTQPPPARADVNWMSVPLKDSAETHRAGAGATHGAFAAYAGAPRATTDITSCAFARDAARRGGKRVFMDDP